MIRALFTAATGMVGQQLNIDTIANNLANVNTTGFKKSRVNFQDLLYETIKPAGTENAGGGERTPEGVQIGHGVRPAAIAKLYTQGNMISTGNALDIVVEGDGFFQVELPDGRRAYSRDGSFKVSATGQLVTADGYPLSPGITVPQDSQGVTFKPDGTVSILDANGAQQAAGQLTLVRFLNPAGLDARLGRNLLLETEASGAPSETQPGVNGAGTIEQGFLENSNVQVVEEILNLIIAQRAYEANSKVIQTSDEMLQLANNVRR
ncbi:MAG: flagellar basal-body rod protein FlgG [FCB group bacterium]|jgi:flagellar basal-body rod protein FlgG|nr:flagellar basal-body rod protein FlgG [FCB group bacterium]